MGAGLVEVVARSGYHVVARSRTRTGADAVVDAVDGQPRNGRSPRAHCSKAERDEVLGRITATDHLGELSSCDLVIESIVEDLPRQAPAVRRARPDRQAVGDPGDEHVDAPGRRAGDGDTTPRPGRAASTSSTRRRTCASSRSSARSRPATTRSRRRWRSPRRAARTPSRSSIEPGSSSTPCSSRISTTPCACTSRARRRSRTSTRRCRGGCNFPMGPFALLDLVGLDTSVAILDALYDEFRDPNVRAGTDAAAQGRRRPTRTQVGRRLLRVLMLPATRRVGTPSVRATSLERGMQQPERHAPRRTADHPLGSCRRRGPPTVTASPASAATSSRGRCWRRTGAACSRCRSAVAGWPGSRRTHERSSRSTASSSHVRCGAACGAIDVRRDTSVRRRHPPLRRPPPSRVVDHPGVRARPTGGCTISAGRTRSSRSTTTASSSADSTASASAASSPARRCSTTPATPPRSPSSGSSTGSPTTGARLLDVQWLTPHLASLGADHREPRRVPSAACRRRRRGGTMTVHCVPRPRRPLLAARSAGARRSHVCRMLQ